MTRVSLPATGWYVEVDLPNGTTAYPDVFDAQVSRNPTANGYPSLEVPVRKRGGMWLNLDLENNDVPMRVWFDGHRQPIDRLEKTRETSDATVSLQGRGGTELESRDERSVDYEAAHTVAENIILDNTTYTANVDRPNTTTETNTIVQTADTQTEWDNKSVNVDQYDPTKVITNGAYGDGEVLTVGQTCSVRETNDVGSKTVSTLVTDSEASNGDCVDLSTSGDYVEISFNLDYTIPSGNTKVMTRHRFPDDPDGDGYFESPDIDIYVDGSLVGGYSDGSNIGSDAYGWRIWDPGDADRGSVTFRVECNGNTAGASYFLDLMAIYDARFHSTTAGDFDNTVDADGYLSSPTLYPIGATKANYPDREFDGVEPAEAVTGGRSELDVDTAGGIQEIALSNDRGETWQTSGADVATYEVDFASFGPSLRQRLTLAGTDETRTTATPTQGYNAPEIDSYTLKADLEDLPLVVDQSFDDSAMGNLQHIAEQLGDFIFEYRVGPSGSESVEWTTPGQRTTSREDPVSSFEATKNVEKMVERVVVKGSSRRKADESFTANVGTWVDLTESDIQLGRSVVTDSTGTVYVEGSDYKIDPQRGRVKALESGDLTDGNSYEIDYSYRPSGTATVDNPPSNPKTETVDLPELPSDRACQHAAKRILAQTDTPLLEGVVTIPSDQAGWNIVEAVNFDVLPFDNLDVRDIENTPDSTVLKFGSRQSLGDVVGQLRTRLQSVSRRA